MKEDLDVTAISPPPFDLWIGSLPPAGTFLRRAGFEALVLCAEEYQPEASQFHGLEVRHAPFSDDQERGLDEAQLRTALSAAEWTAGELLKRKRCLVTCHAGRNRSGLVCALALSRATGISTTAAADRVKHARRGSLTNTFFVDLLNGLRGGERCQLCQAEELTRRYHEDHICWVADCLTCRVPMVVLRRHSIRPTEVERRHMLEMLKLCCPPSKSGWKVDETRHSIPSHWHAHARPAWHAEAGLNA